MEVGEGVTLDRFVEIDAPSVGTSARAGVLTASIAGFDLKLANTFVAWTNGTVVAVVVVLAFDDEDRSRTAGRLATRMDQRIAGVLAGDIEVTPIGEGPTDTPEERALEEGFDLSTMIFTVADLPEGAVEISGAGYLEEEEAIAGYQRGFQAAPGEQVMVVGSSAIITIQANLELYGGPLDARTGVLLLRELDTETFAQETGAPLAAGFGVSSEDVTFSVLGVPAFGDATAGSLMTVTTEVGDFDIHLIYVARGRIRAELVVFGGGGLVSLDDTVPSGRAHCPEDHRQLLRGLAKPDTIGHTLQPGGPAGRPEGRRNRGRLRRGLVSRGYRWLRPRPDGVVLKRSSNTTVRPL